MMMMDDDDHQSIRLCDGDNKIEIYCSISPCPVVIDFCMYLNRPLLWMQKWLTLKLTLCRCLLTSSCSSSSPPSSHRLLCSENDNDLAGRSCPIRYGDDVSIHHDLTPLYVLQCQHSPPPPRSLIYAYCSDAVKTFTLAVVRQKAKSSTLPSAATTLSFC